MTDDKTPEFGGPVSGLTLTSPGPGKVIWPDGTEVSAEQFQDSVTAATIAFEKGLAAGRREALLEAERALWGEDAEDDATYERLCAIPRERTPFYVLTIRELRAKDEPCSCGSRETYSLTPGEWIEHGADACKIKREDHS